MNKQTKAPDFQATTIYGQSFQLSDYRGEKIFLAFYRNGACALCNLRIHELIERYDELESMNLKIVAVFESSVEDMKPYVGKQQVPFTLLSDPEGILYDLYGVETSEAKIQTVMQKELAKDRIIEAASKGYELIPQEGSNFFRMPADFLIDENLVIQKVHYTDHLIDHLPMDEILNFAAEK